MSIDVTITDRRIGTRWPAPHASPHGLAGIELRACLSSTLTLHPGHCELVSAGVAVSIDDRDVVAAVAPNPVLGHQYGICLGNSLVLLGPEAAGEVFVSVWNRSGLAYRLTPGEPIAQLLFLPVVTPQVHLATQERMPQSTSSAGNCA